VGGVSREVPSVPSPLELSGTGPKDELDPELLALPDPPRRERTLTVAVLSVAAALSLAMVFGLRRDVAYALASTTPAALDLREATSVTLASHENRFVHAELMLGAAGGIRYERPFVDDSFRTLPAASRQDVWVDVRVPAGQENGRWEPPRSFAGRLVRFDAAGPRQRGLASAIERTTGSRVPADAWLLVDGDDPESARWTILLAAMFLGFAAWNAAAIARIVRKVR
jgi:hypothetical protein